MKRITVSERTLNAIRNYVARQSLAGVQLTVDDVVQRACAGELAVPGVELRASGPVDLVRERHGRPAFRSAIAARRRA